MDDTRSAPRAGAVSRRTVLRIGGAALAGASTGPFVFTPARAQGFNWKRFQGRSSSSCSTSTPGSTRW
jgi:hypothetical protein